MRHHRKVVGLEYPDRIREGSKYQVMFALTGILRHGKKVDVCSRWERTTSVHQGSKTDHLVNVAWSRTLLIWAVIIADFEYDYEGT